MAKRFLSLMLCLAAAFVLAVPVAQAANACQEADIKGDTGGTVEFVITTGPKWKMWGDSVTLTQTKGRLTYDTWTGQRTTDEYGYFHVRAYKETDTTCELVKEKEWTDGSTSVSGLERNSTYKIVVEPYSYKEIGAAHPIRFSAYNAMKNGGDMYWESQSPAKWTTSATSKGVESCSFAQ